MSNFSPYSQAVSDFRAARQKADLQNLLSMLTGKKTELLSYEEVRQKLRAIEGSRQELRDIPLEAIIGSVGRYSDFNRDFLPRRENDQERWARVMVQATGPTGLPPIDVYQIGEAYFVLDGNHRVSVAKALGSSHIQANVTEVKTKVQFAPDSQPDDLILKAEYADFLEKTSIKPLRPESDLSVTVPGRYPVLLEHIAVHQYYMGLDEKRDITYEEAVFHWYDQVYLPVIDVIRERGILRTFPNRTETDLYIWLAKHREELETNLGWKFETETVADNLMAQYAAGLSQTIGRVTSRILDAVTPDGLESGPSTGHWRAEHLAQDKSDHLFSNILVGISKDDNEWQALDQAIQIAQREKATLRGLHVIPNPKKLDSPKVKTLTEEFKRRCAEAGLQGELAVEVGSAARQICERAQWADLVIGKLTHPPANKLLARLSSGFRIMVRRCSRPILAVPGEASPIRKALLAYNGSPKAEEALFIAAYMACKWEIPLVVLTVEHSGINAEAVQAAARDYLGEENPSIEYLVTQGEVVQNVLKTAQDRGCDLILIGGYKASPVVEIVKGSLVDELLRETNIPTLICR